MDVCNRAKNQRFNGFKSVQKILSKVVYVIWNVEINDQDCGCNIAVRINVDSFYKTDNRSVWSSYIYDYSKCSLDTWQYANRNK